MSRGRLTRNYFRTGADWNGGVPRARMQRALRNVKSRAWNSTGAAGIPKTRAGNGQSGSDLTRPAERKRNGQRRDFPNGKRRFKMAARGMALEAGSVAP